MTRPAPIVPPLHDMQIEAQAMHKIIQISAVAHGDERYVYGLCDDNTVLEWESGGPGWAKIEPIPQDETEPVQPDMPKDMIGRLWWVRDGMMDQVPLHTWSLAVSLYDIPGVLVDADTPKQAVAEAELWIEQKPGKPDLLSKTHNGQTIEYLCPMPF